MSIWNQVCFLTYTSDLGRCLRKQGQHLVFATCFLNDGFFSDDRSLQDI